MESRGVPSVCHAVLVHIPCSIVPRSQDRQMTNSEDASILHIGRSAYSAGVRISIAGSGLTRTRDLIYDMSCKVRKQAVDYWTLRGRVSWPRRHLDSSGCPHPQSPPWRRHLKRPEVLIYGH
ncbi:hypothetical protein BC834DRAFT_890030 [Gloeopeniophorella convolvens]|nr:hypothetical protein BC834DRAFT_890030 [Gloeopeniophorella convolvens]